MITHKNINETFEAILNNAVQYQLFKRLYTVDDARVIVAIDAVRTDDKSINPDNSAIYIYIVSIDINYNEGQPENSIIIKQFLDVINAFKYIARMIENEFKY